MRYPMTTVAERDTPARQCTRARPFEARASLMKSTHASKCVAMSEAASERSLIGQRMYLRWDEPSKKLETSSVALRMCVTSRVVSLSMSLAVTRSPRKRKPGRISPFHESSKSGLVDLEPLRSMVRPAWLRVDACLPSVSVGCPTLVIIPSVSGSCAERPRFSASADESCPALTRSRSSPSPDKCAGPSLQGCVRPSLGAAGASLPCNSASAWRIPCKWRQTSSRCTPDSSPFSSSVCSVPLR
mmetsp:Transcript_7828/g.18392  ORF Transcript_7828/g.18392 Transcript_7828/m.18392 type:complete len:243 (+) Transcript_7828:496-1224(+)